MSQGGLGFCSFGIGVSVVWTAICGVGIYDRATFVPKHWIHADVAACTCQRFEHREADNTRVWFAPVYTLNTTRFCNVTGSSFGSETDCADSPELSQVRVWLDGATCRTDAPGFRVNDPWFIASCVLGPALWPIIGVIAIIWELLSPWPKWMRERQERARENRSKIKPTQSVQVLVST